MENANPLGCRVRYFGGTTSRWQGWCAPLHDTDFAERAWVPHSGWPIDRNGPRSLLHPRLDIVRSRTGRRRQRPRRAPAIRRREVRGWILALQPTDPIRVHVSRRARERSHTTVLLNCNAIRIETDSAASRVQRIGVAALNGKTGTITARAYVLACGGMENARLLLLSDEVQSEGLGNRSGALGRFFTQHIEVVAAQVQPTDAAQLAEIFQQHRSESVRAHLITAPDMQRSLGLLNTGFSFGNPQAYSSGYRALSDLWHAMAAGRWPDDFGAKVQSVSSDIDSVVKDIFVTRGNAPPYLNLTAYGEQTPNPDSRIGLSSTVDAFGLRRIRVDWRLGAADRASLRTSTLNLAEELGRMKIGRVKLADWLVDDAAPWPQPIWAGCHHMGTTRMSRDPALGVVNADCRVHDVENLYVAGSSVFPTGGYVPPTLTLIAMALRLADHLDKRYA